MPDDESTPEVEATPTPGADTELTQEALDALNAGDTPLAPVAKADPDPTPAPKPADGDADGDGDGDAKPEATGPRSLRDIHDAIQANQPVLPEEVQRYTKAQSDFTAQQKAETERQAKVEAIIPETQKAVVDVVKGLIADLSDVDVELLEGRLGPKFAEMSGVLEEAFVGPYVNVQGGQLEGLGVPLAELTQMPPENYVPVAYNRGLATGKANPDPEVYVKKADAEKGIQTRIDKAVSDALEAHGITAKGTPGAGGSAKNTQINPEGKSARQLAEASAAGTYDLDADIRRVLAGTGSA
ncbi:MAG: hypothetical protein A3E01_15360 [Gammaproteobacteria bacterium RIFCSPHIGHO2_12_FULL_63_22]|nr:MAG: hypothetical protein A3E01_15360 [Gammaproteobacteria bacterium RIFCSPHIGHO2_12_FULL_63_22]